MKSNILVTGGCGFIGSHIVDSYVNDGHKVVYIDDMSSGKHVNDHKNATLIHEDLAVSGLIEDAIEEHRIDIIHHVAARPRVGFSIDFPVETTEENITNTVRVLEAARKYKVGRVIYSASSSAYGDANDRGLTEGKEGEVQSPYALQKRVGEEYCRLYSKLHRLDTVCLRYFNVYGPRSTAESQYSAVIPIFIEQIQNGGPITIHGDGRQRRDFTYIDDVVQANRLAAEYDGKLAGDVFNVGNGGCLTINDVADDLEYLLQAKDIKREYEAPRPGDVRSTEANISKIQDVLGYETATEFDEGLRKTVDWYLEQQR